MIEASIAASVSDTEPASTSGSAASVVVATRYEVTRATELCALLRERPPVFPSARGAPVRPLALGILKALAPLARPEVTPAELKQSLGAYCLGLGYLLAQGRAGAWRYDLAGTPVEPVSEEHRKGSWTRFKGVRAYRDRIRAARRAAAQEASTAACIDDASADVSRQPA